jgi:hypothetical protein
MDVVVDLTDGVAAVAAWDALSSLSVRVDEPVSDGAEDRLTVALAAAGIGRDNGSGDVLLPSGVLRGLAAEAAAAEGRSLDAAWDEAFAGMLAYAATKGWIDDDGAVRAHVEWRDA